MKKITKQLNVLIVSMLLTGFACMAQSSGAPNNEKNKKETQTEMKTYVIERNIPGAGQFTPEKLKSISETSCTVLKELGPGIQWLHSYVTEDKVYCVYLAPDEDSIREHARRAGIPADRVSAVRRLIDPAALG